MSPSKPGRASEVRLGPADLVATDPVGLPMVDVRGRAHVRRATLAAQNRGSQRGRIGVDLAVLGTVAPDEIEQLCEELIAMRNAAIAAQVVEDSERALADEVEDLAARCSLVDLRAALTGPADALGDEHDREVIFAAIELAEQRAERAAARS